MELAPLSFGSVRHAGEGTIPWIKLQLPPCTSNFQLKVS